MADGKYVFQLTRLYVASWKGVTCKKARVRVTSCKELSPRDQRTCDDMRKCPWCQISSGDRSRDFAAAFVANIRLTVKGLLSLHVSQ